MMLQSYLHCAKGRFYLSFSLLDKAALFERFVSDGIQRNNSCNRIVDTALGADNLVCFLADMKATRSPVETRIPFLSNKLRGIDPHKVRNTHLSV